MIVVRTKQDAFSTLIQVSGHANGDKNDLERKIVCSAVSAIMFSLYAATDFCGDWHGNNSGFLSVQVHESQYPLIKMTLKGLLLVNDGYPGHIVFERNDQLVSETELWQKMQKIA